MAPSYVMTLQYFAAVFLFFFYALVINLSMDSPKFSSYNLVFFSGEEK
jgi:hypothetical protein